MCLHSTGRMWGLTRLPGHCHWISAIVSTQEGELLLGSKEMGVCRLLRLLGQVRRLPRRPWDLVAHPDAHKVAFCNKEEGAMALPGVALRPAIGILGLPEEAHLLIAEGLEIGDR